MKSTTEKAIKYVEDRKTYKKAITRIIKTNEYPELIVRGYLLWTAFIKLDGSKLEQIDFKVFINHFRSD